MLAIIIPLIFIGGIPFAIAIGFISLFAYKEVVELKQEHIPNLIKVLGVISLLLIIYSPFNGYQALIIAIILLLIPSIFYINEKYTTGTAFYLIGFTFLLGLFFNALILIQDASIQYLGLLIIIIFITDSFAFLIGKLIGKHKIIPSVSPNKTIEGTIAGAVMGVLLPTIYYFNVINSDVNLLKIMFFILILSTAGQIGDLFFSKIKREHKLKDFSNLIPGHGGVLDRLDSLIFVVITYLIIFNFI